MQSGPPRGRYWARAQCPGPARPAVILVLVLSTLLCVLAPHRAQAQEATWDGTVLVRNASLHIGPGERTTHSIRLSKKPSVNGVETSAGDEWQVFLYINGTRSKQRWYRDLDIIPSMFRRFFIHDWDTWKDFAIYRLTDEEWQARKDDDANFPGIDDDTPRATSVRFTHEVWDHNANCPVHNVGPVTLGNSGGNSDNGNNNNNNNNGNSGDNGNNDNIENGGTDGNRETDGTVTTPPDSPYTFTPDDFADTGGDPFECVRITTLPANGVLTLNGVAVSAGDEISRSDIDAGRLVFTPGEGGSGSPYTSFDFQVGDCEDLENEPTRTITIDLPDDADTPGGPDNPITTPPDGSYTFTPDDFSDTGDDPFECVRIATLPADGVLTLNGVAVSTGDEISRSDIDAGRLIFTPDEGESGSPYTSFDFQVGDCGDLENEPTHTITIEVPPGEPDGPGGPGNPITTPPDGTYPFTPDDFSGTGGDSFECIQIVTLPADGVLTLNGVAVNTGDEIRKTDIDAGHLVFTPDEGESGSPYTSFTYRAGDCGDLEDEPARMITIHVQHAPPPRAPGRPELTRSGDGTTSLDARWTAPGNTHCPNACPKITHYRLQYRRGPGGIWESWTDVPGNAEETFAAISVPDLESRYQVRVRAVNAEGTAGPWSGPGTWFPPGEQANARLMMVWLPRFARTVSDQVIDAVGARLRAPAEPAGLQAEIAGQRLAGTRGGTGVATASHALVRGSTDTAHYPPYLDQYDAWHEAGDGTGVDVRTRGLGNPGILRNTAFSYASGDAGTGMMSIWGRGAASAFDGQDDDRNLEVDGEVRSLLLGTEIRNAKGVFGTLLAHSSGRGDYQGEADGKGRIHASLTGMYPYASHEVSRGLSVWGIAGFGLGEARDFRGGGTPVTRGIDLLMATGGVRSRLPEAVPGDPSFPAIDAVADVMAVQISSDGPIEAGEETKAAVSRLRLGLESTWETLEAGGGLLAPMVRVGFRADGGDADRGLGADFEARLHWDNPDEGIRMQLRYHGLVWHEEDEFREIGLSGSVSWDPDLGSRRGAAISLASSVSGSAIRGLNSFPASPGYQDVLPGLVETGDADRYSSAQVQVRAGYGLGVFDDRLTGIPEIGVTWTGDSQRYSAGWRLMDERSGTFEIQLEATHRRFTDNGESDDGIGVRLGAYW